MTDKLYGFLFKSIDVSIVSIFRIVFGAFMIYQMIFYYDINYTHQFISGPEVLFPYAGLEFLQPLSVTLLKAIHFGLLISAILITLGFWYRYAMIIFFLGFSYFSFVDKTLYNNHIYLIALIALVMIFIKADKKYSLHSKFSKKPKSNLVPAWNQNILIFLISIAYFFGGIAKLSSNWLDTNIVQYTIRQAQNGFLSNLFSEGMLVHLIKYGGLLFDLSIVFILLNKKTRKYGVLLVILFSYINNSVLFNDIGIFPFFMIGSTILFFDGKKIGQFFDALIGKKSEIKVFKNKKERLEYKSKQEASLKFINSEQQIWTTSKKLTAFLLCFFVMFHLLFPLRHFLLTNNPEWTGIASRFSWRMKMQSRKITDFKMSITDRKSLKTYNLDGRSYVSQNQFIHMIEDPYTFIHLAKYISKKLEKERGIINPIIRADIKVEFNGMKSQYMISPTVDLTQLNESHFANSSWIPNLENNN